MVDEEVNEVLEGDECWWVWGVSFLVVMVGVGRKEEDFEEMC